MPAGLPARIGHYAITQKLVDPDDAYRYANDRKKFERFVTDTTVLPSMQVGRSGA